MAHLGPVASPTTQSKNHSDYFWNFAKFEVEGTIFQLPIRPFVQGSKAFASNHHLIDELGEDGLYEERTDCTASVLNVTRSEFEAFVKALIPPIMQPPIQPPDIVVHRPPTGFSIEEWTSILKLSSLWVFSSIRLAAIEYFSRVVSSKGVGLSETLHISIAIITRASLLARECKVSALLEQSYNALANIIVYHRSFSLEEAAMIGKDTAHELQSLALQRMRRADAISKGDRGPAAAWVDVRHIPLLSAELTSLEEEEKEVHGRVWQPVQYMGI